jgi:CRISPR-associated endonuclease/helicase Cas3
LIFTSIDHALPPELKTYADKMHETLSIERFRADPLSLEAIQDYFNRVYWQHESGQNSQLDKHNILGHVKDSRPDSLPFEWVAQKFKMISSAMKTVIVPYDKIAREAIEALRLLPDYLGVGQVARTLQVYTISMPQYVAAELIKLGALKYLLADRYGEQFLVLESDNMYTESIGFNLAANPVMMSGDDCVI